MSRVNRFRRAKRVKVTKGARTRYVNETGNIRGTGEGVGGTGEGVGGTGEARNTRTCSNTSDDHGTGANRAFNPLLLVERHEPDFLPPELSSCFYKNYTVGFSIDIEDGYPHRVLSIAPHGFDPQPMKDTELQGALKHFGFYSFLPIENFKIEHPFDPFTGDTQYYRQMVMDLDELKDLPSSNSTSRNSTSNGLSSDDLPSAAGE